MARNVTVPCDVGSVGWARNADIVRHFPELVPHGVFVFVKLGIVASPARGVMVGIARQKVADYHDQPVALPRCFM